MSEVVVVGSSIRIILTLAKLDNPQASTAVRWWYFINSHSAFIENCTANCPPSLLTIIISSIWPSQSRTTIRIKPIIEYQVLVMLYILDQNKEILPHIPGQYEDIEDINQSQGPPFLSRSGWQGSGCQSQVKSKVLYYYLESHCNYCHHLSFIQYRL